MSFMAPQQKRLVDLVGDRASLALALNASALYAGMLLGSGVDIAVHGGVGPPLLPAASLAFVVVAMLALEMPQRPPRA